MTAKDSLVPDSLRSSLYIGMCNVIPLGDYRSTDRNNPDAGYAWSGFGAELGYSYCIAKNFHLRADLAFSKSAIDFKQISDQALEQTQEQTGFTEITASATTGFWKNYFVHAGFSYQFWLGETKKISVEPVLMAGIDYCKTPYVQYEVRIGNLTVEKRSMPKGCVLFSHKEAVKLNCILGNRTIAFFQVGYYGAMGNGSGLEQIVSGNNTYTRTLSDYKVNVSQVFAGLGISTWF